MTWTSPTWKSASLEGLAGPSIRTAGRWPVGLALALIVAVGGCRDDSGGTTTPNQPPGTPIIASPTGGASYAPGEAIDFQGSATDPEDGALTGASLSWTSSLDGAIGTGASFTRNDLAEGLHTITLTAQDMDGLRSMASVAIEVANAPPQPTIGAPQDGAVFSVGATIGFQGTATDAEDGPLSGASLVWTSDLDGPIGTGTSFTRSDLSPGTHTVTLTATDSDGESASTSVTISVRSPPTVSIALPEQGSEFVEGSTVTFQGAGSDPEDGTLTGGSLVWTSTLGGQLGTGTSFSRADLAVGVHTITLTATDSDGLTASASVGITVLGVGGSPTAEILSPADGASLSVGSSITFQGTATDAEDGTLGGASMVWTSDVDGDIGTGTSFSRSDLSSGTHVITLTATDSDALTGTDQVTITLLSGPSVSISSPSNGADYDQGASISFQGSATDAEDGSLTGDALVWTSSRDGEIGTGASFSRSDLSGGNHVITLTATDSDGIAGSASVSITVLSGAAPSVTISSPSSGTSVDVGTNVSFQGSATDPEDGSLSGGSLVWTSSLDGRIGTGTSFSRSALSVGNHTITLRATDSDGRSGSDAVSLEVEQTEPILVEVGGDAASNIAVGGQTSLAVRVDLSEYSPATEGDRLASIQVRVTWDTDVASFASKTDGSFGLVNVNTDNVGSGEVVASTISGSGTTSSFTLFTLRLEGESDGTTNVSVSVQTAGTENGADITSQTEGRDHGLTVGGG